MEPRSPRPETPEAEPDADAPSPQAQAQARDRELSPRLLYALRPASAVGPRATPLSTLVMSLVSRHFRQMSRHLMLKTSTHRDSRQMSKILSRHIHLLASRARWRQLTRFEK